MSKRRLRGSVYQRKSTDGRWCAALRIEGRKSPVVRYASWQRNTEREAERILAQMIREAEAGLVLGQHQTLSQYLQAWLTDTKRPEVAPLSLATYAACIKQRWLPTLGHVALQSLTPAHIRGVLNAMRDRGLAPKTVQFAHVVLKSALESAVKDGLLPRNPARSVRPTTVPRRKPTYWQPHEARAFLQHIQGSRYEHLWTLALYTGMRRGELLGLRWADVDWERGVLHVTQSAKRYGGKVHLSTTKTEESAGAVWLPGAALGALRARHAAQLRERARAGAKWRDTGLVFTTHLGGPMEPSQVTDAFPVVVRSSGLPKIRLHDLRHTCAVLLLKSGVPLNTVSKMLRHTSIRTTADLYGHVLEEEKQEAAQRLDSLLSSG